MEPHPPPRQVLLPRSRLKELAALVSEDLVAFVDCGGADAANTTPELAAYRQALQLVLSLRALHKDSILQDVSMTAHALNMEDERDWLMILVGRLRSALRVALEDLQTGRMRSCTRAILKNVLS